jgi:hypothetical protein
MIKLNNLLIEAETFTAVNKKTGKTSIFRSKASKADAIKAGTHTNPEDKKSDKPDTKTPTVNIFDKPAKNTSAKSDKSGDKSSTEFDTPKIQSTKIKDIMPKADKKTFNAPSDINKISDSDKREISMKIDELDKITSDAKAKGEEAPNYNLCKITVAGTNLYCAGNAGIPREEMPQFKGKPTPGSPADKLPKDAKGEVDTEPMFQQMLKDGKIKTVETEIPSDRLKATQSELVGSKVAGMAKALEKDPNHPGITAPIYVSRDGYVIDGHHRWAAVTSAAIASGKPANMKVIVIDMDIKDAIPMCNKFAEDQGVAAKKADANQEGPKADKPTSEPKKKRPGNPSVNKDAKKLAEKSGITPQKLGNEKYKEAMFQAAVSALTDSNFHSEARELVAAIEGKPEFAKKPEYPSIKDPKYKEKMDDIRKNSADGSVYMNGTGEIDDYGTDVSQASGWDGVDAADGIAFTLRMNGFHKEADLIQSVFDNKPYMKNEGRISLTKMVKEGKFKEDDLVYNKRTKTVGIVRMGDDKYGEVKTDADGNVNVDELEKYNPIKNKHQQNAKVAPSTEKEVNSRGLFNPFKSESIKLAKLVK